MKSNLAFGTIVILLLGCGGEANHSKPADAKGGSAGQTGGGGTSAPGAAGTGGGTGGAGTGGASAGAAGSGAAGAAGAISSPEDFKALEQCGPSSCGTSELQGLGEGGRRIKEDEARCILTAMRDRKPGFYRHRASSVFASGSVRTEQLFVVTADGSVQLVTHTSSQDYIGPNSGDKYSSAERCQLKEASFFQACIDAINGTSGKDDAAAWQCLVGKMDLPEWTQACAPAEPSCK